MTNWKQNTIKIIEKYENNIQEAYCDELYWNEQDKKYYKDYVKCENWWRRSIWFWTISFKWEKISKEEWKKRLMDYLWNMFPLIENNKCYNDNQKTAIADFMYNSWANTLHNVTKVKFIKYVNNCNYNVIEWFLAPYNYKPKWMKKRRQVQYNFWKWIQKY